MSEDTSETERLLRDYMSEQQDDESVTFKQPTSKPKARKVVEPVEGERVFGGKDAVGWVVAAGEAGLILGLFLILLGVF